MAIQALTPLPATPSRNDAPENFVQRADTYLAAQNRMVTEFNTAISGINDFSSASSSSKGAALIGYRGRTVAQRLAESLNVRDFGAVGDGVTDDTAAIQAAFDYFASTKTTPVRSQQRCLDFAGLTYKVSAPLSLAGCDGLCLQNGTLAADKTKPFASNRAILEHTADAELWGLTITPSLTIQCNQVANGINLQRHQEFLALNPTILGWGQREFGMWLGPLNYSCDASIVGPRISGFSESYADNPVATRKGVGLIGDVADGTVVGGYIDTGKKCVVLNSSMAIYNCHIWNGNPGDETKAETNNIGVEINGSASNSLVGNTFDNCCVVIVGQSLYKHIVSNKFYSNQTQLQAGIILRASAAGQTLADLNIQGNQFHGYYDRPILVDQSVGTFTTMTRVMATNNPLRSLAAANGGYASSLAATVGSIIVSCTTGHFNTDFVMKVDLGGKALLLPSYKEVLGVSVGIQYVESQSTNPANAVHWTRYDPATGVLSIKFTAAFNGRLKIDFDQSYSVKLVTPNAAA